MTAELIERAWREPGRVPWREAVSVYLRVAVDNPNTARAYSSALHRALPSMGVATLADLNPLILAGWRQVVCSDPELSPSTRRLTLAAMRSLLRWTHAAGLHTMGSDVVRYALRLPRKHTMSAYTALTEDDARKLLAAAQRSRNHALIALMLGTGLRVSEVAALDVRDCRLDAATPHLVVRSGKGDRDALQPIGDDLAAILRPLVRHRPGTEPLFRKLGSRERLEAPGIRMVIQRLVARAGIEGRVTPHALRHTYAVRAYTASGKDLVTVRELMRHQDVDTTAIYLAPHLRHLGDLRTSVPRLPHAG